jgi:hypothetical protein
MKTLKWSALFLALCVTFVASPARAGSLCDAVAGNLVTNCGFETGGLDGWSLTGDTSFTGVNVFNVEVHSGSYALNFGSVEGPSYLEQDIATVAGGTYQLGFWLANDGGTPSSFAVSWNGTTLYSENNAGGYDYTEFTFSNLAATGASTPLLFEVFQQPNWYHLDDVQVTSGATPEPASFLLISPALLGFAVLRRKFRK